MQKAIRCAPLRGLSRTPSQRPPTLHLYYSDGVMYPTVFKTHLADFLLVRPWSIYLSQLWNGSIHRWCGTTARGPFPVKVPTPSIGGRTLLVQLGGVFFDKTLAQSPSAAPVRFCFMAHGSHRFIVCSVQGSPRGPHRKRCATSRGPPCKQGATIATLHFTISVFVVLPNFTHDSNSPLSYV